ncbi:hypothetical protein [Acidovorax sp. SUPP2825]|uniref:hypothetical protein n=1 Tax=Acidovorax sp. SUPP2825 TaxID=2920879 RepID=UPI0023DE4C28|nr:hypothetical protein [Acidovorax sp. SUPP2825]GKS96939.1 hypothetical protein AVAK2825_20410 [Acidovorax sp. SUPP2825]
MLAIRRTGPSIAEVIASVRDVPTRIIPYAASTALTRTAQYAQQIELPAEMRKVFRSPVSYTTNSLRVEPSTKDTLSARVMVKDKAAGLAPENYLLPEVEGGGRKHKGAEMAMRYAGVLSPSQFAMPGAGLTLDAAGNVKGSEVRTILAALKNLRGGVGAKGQAAGRGRKLANDLFVGKPNGGDRPEGIWRREGKRLRALFVFTNNAPDYSRRLDFGGVVQRVALERFRPEFEKAVGAMLARG